MSLELIIGPMFAGKSSALQSIVRRRKAIGWNVLVIKHHIDIRYLSDSKNNNEVVNHDQQKCPARSCSLLKESLSWEDYNKAQLIVIEEGQFFEDLVEFVLLAVEKHNKHVVVVGLDGDAHRKPFGKILDLIPLADEVQRIYALCKLCGDGTPARFSSAVSHTVSDATIDGKPNVGAAESYQPLCRRHFLELYNYK
jgi:thymidine kinase